MKKNTKGIKQFLMDAKAISPAIATLILIVIAAVAAAGIGVIVNNAQTKSASQVGSQNLDVSGNLNIKGSTTVLPISQAAASAFEKQYPAVVINTAGGGSGFGRYFAYTTTNPTTDMGASSEVWPSTIDTSFIPNVPNRDNAVIQAAASGNANIYETKIATGMVVLGYYAATAPTTPVSINNSGSVAYSILKYSDLQVVYINGTTMPATFTAGKLNVYYRNDNSGTMDTFMAWLGNPNYVNHVYTPPTGGNASITYIGLKSNEDIRDAIATCPAGTDCIGPVDVGFTGTNAQGKPTVTATTQNGTAAIAANKGVGKAYDAASITNSGSKGLARDLYYYNQGVPSGAMKSYLDWMTGINGQAIVQAQGFFSP